jgi:hypothetical protein
MIMAFGSDRVPCREAGCSSSTWNVSTSKLSSWIVCTWNLSFDASDPESGAEAPGMTKRDQRVADIPPSASCRRSYRSGLCRAHEDSLKSPRPTNPCSIPDPGRTGGSPILPPRAIRNRIRRPVPRKPRKRCWFRSRTVPARITTHRRIALLQNPGSRESSRRTHFGKQPSRKW